MAEKALMQDKLSRQSIANFKLFDQQATEVGAAAEKLPAVAMNYRKGMFIYNMETAGTYVYLGASDVTGNSTEATGGFPLNGGTYMFIELDGSVDLYAISAGGNVTVHTLEVG